MATVTITPEWLVACDACSYVRRYRDPEQATVAALAHPSDCPGKTPLIDKKPRRGRR